MEFDKTNPFYDDVLKICSTIMFVFFMIMVISAFEISLKLALIPLSGIGTLLTYTKSRKFQTAGLIVEVAAAGGYFFL